MLLVGGPGTAKTNITNQFLGSFNVDQSSAKTITFSSLTTPGIFQATLEARSFEGVMSSFNIPLGKLWLCTVVQLVAKAIIDFSIRNSVHCKTTMVARHKQSDCIISQFLQVLLATNFVWVRME